MLRRCHYSVLININKRALSVTHLKRSLFGSQRSVPTSDSETRNRSFPPNRKRFKSSSGTEVKMAADKENLLLNVIASSVKIADRAGSIIRDVMSAGTLNIVDKGINDFQTEADRRAQRCILASLHKKFPSVTIIGEEDETSDDAEWVELDQSEEVMSQAANLPQELKFVDPSDMCIWVDPLDGTNEYTQGYLDHVTVLIGVAVKGEAVAGIMHQPYYNPQSSHVGRTIWGIVGLGAFGIEKRFPMKGCRKALTTRSHETELVRKAVEACEVTDIIKVGGAGFKVLTLIEGSAHAYIFANEGCKKWDTCAPEAILRAVGGRLTDVHGRKLRYTPEVERPNYGGVIATALGEDHDWYIERIPSDIKDQLKSALE